VDPGHSRSGATLETARAVVVHLTASKSAEDFRLGVGKHTAETVYNGGYRVDR